MAEENTSTKPAVVDAAKHNEDIARTLADQDASGHSTTLTEADLKDTGSALDKLATARSDKNQEPVVDPKPDDKKNEAAPKTDEPGVPAAPTAEELARQEAAKKAEEIFKDSPGLSPNASPKSSEAFSQIKIKAAQEISAREQALEDLRKEKASLEEKLKNTAPPEALKELEEHRKWRAQLDVAASPKFQEFDKKVSSTREFIYSQLKRFPSISDKVIEQIQKFGGPDMVNMEPILKSLNDPAAQRLIETRLADIEMEKFEKEKAIKETKDNIDKYLSEQKENFQKSVTAHNEATKAQFTGFASRLPWYKEVTPEPKATDADKKSVQEHNEFVKTVRTQLDEAMKDDSPEMRAILLTGMAQLLHLQRVHEVSKAEIEALKKQLVDATGKLSRFTTASTSRIKESGAPPGGKLPTPKQNPFTTHAGDALDQIAKQVMEEKARSTGNGG